jgi:chromosome segregation ATPase
MAKIGITYEQVASAANQLSSQNKRPTLEAIRRILGTGSNSTLVKHLAVWRTNEEGTTQIAQKEQIPEPLVIALKSVWHQVTEQAQHQIQQIEQQTQQTISTIQHEFTQLQQTHDLLQQQNHQLKQKYASLDQEKNSLNHLLHQANLDLAALSEKSIGHQNQVHEKQERIKELHQQNQQVQANLDHYRDAALIQRQQDHQYYEQQINQLNGTIQSIQTENLAIKKENSDLKQTLSLLSFEKDSLKEKLAKIEEQYQSQTIEFSQAQTELVRKSQDVEYLSKQWLEVQQKYEAQSKILIDAQTQEAVSSQQVLQLQKDLKELRDQNQVLAYEKLVLTQEKAQIDGQFKQLGLT